MIFFWVNCITMAPQVDSKVSQSCDIIGLQKQVCADSFEPLLQEIEKVGMSLTDQCLLYPTRRSEIDLCIQKTECTHFAKCISDLAKKPWKPQNDPDLCDAFRLKKRPLLPYITDPDQLYLYHKSGAACETDQQLAAQCVTLDGKQLWNCIQNHRDLIPGDM